MSRTEGALASLKLLENRRLMLIERSAVERQRLRAGLGVTLQPQMLRNTVRDTVMGILMRNAALLVLPLSSSVLPVRLVRLTMGVWLVYRTFTALRAGLKR